MTVLFAFVLCSLERMSRPKAMMPNAARVVPQAAKKTHPASTIKT